MTETLIAPENETFPNRRRWTREECERLAEKGELTGRYELIDGEILSKMGQHAPHASTIIFLTRWLLSLFGVDYLRIQLPIVIPGRFGKTNEPEPDLAVTRETFEAYFGQNPGPSDVRLVVEVSDSSLNFDLNTKALLYARVNIPEYLVLDVAGRQVYRHRVPKQSGYRETVIFGENDNLTLLDRTETIRVGALLPPAPNSQ